MNWLDYSPNGSKNGDIYQDVISRCLDPYLSSDKVTNCHESTHGIHAHLRMMLGSNSDNNYKLEGFYVGGGKWCKIEQPRMSLSDAAKHVKQELRNDQYRLYFQEAAQWYNNRPLMILDEMSAYTNGCQTAHDFQIDDHGEYRFANYFCHYADCVVAAIGAHDPTYDDLANLVEFIDYQKNRVSKLTA